MIKSKLLLSRVPVQQKHHAPHKIVKANHGSHELKHCQVTLRFVKVSRVAKTKEVEENRLILNYILLLFN